MQPASGVVSLFWGEEMNHHALQITNHNCDLVVDPVCGRRGASSSTLWHLTYGWCGWTYGLGPEGRIPSSLTLAIVLDLDSPSASTSEAFRLPDTRNIIVNIVNMI